MKHERKLWFTGGTLYVLIEILYKGNSHLSMFAAGGTALTLIDKIDGKWMRGDPLPQRLVAGALAITAIEFVVGCVVNLLLHRNEWDYSHLPGHILGQICPLFTAVWLVLSLPAIGICRLLRR